MPFAQGDPGGPGLRWEPGLGLACLCYAGTARWGWLSLPAFPAQTQHCKFSSEAVGPLCPSSGSPFSDPPISLSIPSPERHLRPCWSSSTPKSARDNCSQQLLPSPPALQRLMSCCEPKAIWAPATAVLGNGICFAGFFFSGQYSSPFI